MTLDRIMMFSVTFLVAGLITFIQISRPNLQELFNIKTAEAPKTASPVKPEATQTPSSTAATTETKPAEQPAASAQPAPSTPAVKTATTVSFVHMRTGKGTNTPIVMDLDGGTVVQLRSDSDRYWQGITYQGKNGYIYKTYLQY